MQKHITIVCFAGPSGSGKTELKQRLVEMYPDNLTCWKQATTRAKRGPNDDYVFMTKPMYDVVRSTLTCRTEFNGNHYGTFPEPVNADTAVLTIADAMGLSDLLADVENHNNHVNNGHAGKLGLHPIKLVTVLMTYDLTSADEVHKRGADRNGTRSGEFLQSEEEKLRAVTAFDFELDSTGGNWTQPEQFFSEAIWPAICTPMGGDTFESLYAQIEHELIEIGEGCRAVRDLDALRGVLSTLRGASEYVNEWVNSEPEGGVDADDIDAVLSGSVQCDASMLLMNAQPAVPSQEEIEAGFDNAEQIYNQRLAQAELEEAAEDQPQYPSDYLNDRTPENAPEVMVPSDMTAVEADVSEVIIPEPTEASIVGTSAPEAQTEYAAAVQATKEAEEAIAAAALKPYSEIFAESDFTDWMLQNTIGLEAFEDEAKFKLIFSQYVSANGGDPNGIEVGSQATKDGKGGRVVGYTAYMSDGSRYGIEFNERIKQVVKYGAL
jgi:hypothetical protein